MSKDLLYELIEALTILPGVGKKSAQRMALFLLDKNKDGAAHLAKFVMLFQLKNVLEHLAVSFCMCLCVYTTTELVFAILKFWNGPSGT